MRKKTRRLGLGRKQYMKKIYLKKATEFLLEDQTTNDIEGKVRAIEAFWESNLKILPKLWKLAGSQTRVAFLTVTSANVDRISPITRNFYYEKQSVLIRNNLSSLLSILRIKFDSPCEKYIPPTPRLPGIQHETGP